MELDEFVGRFTESVDFPEAVEITPDSVITELEYWDSLAQLGVIVMFELEFQMTITAEDIAGCSTIGDLYKLSFKSGN